MKTAKAHKENANLIKLNRAPLLTLWVAVVAEREGYSFFEGLSFGKCIAGIFAHSKGRRLGIIHHNERKRKRKKEAEKFNVFGMEIAGITTNEGIRLALQNGKPISPSSVESYLRRAFGDRYEQVKEAMRDLAKAYPAQKIGSEAYALYKKFRPKVARGIRGWAAKGYLDLNLLRQLAGKV